MKVYRVTSKSKFSWGEETHKLYIAADNVCQAGSIATELERDATPFIVEEVPNLSYETKKPDLILELL